MKLIVLSILLAGLSSTSWAWTRWENRRPYRDAWNNPYKYQQNLYKDSDGDGISNRYDYNDHNATIQRPVYQNPFSYEYRPRSSHPLRFQQPNFLFGNE